ncbi:MAG: fumarylacetoacetate hydrolase family protein [Steroidobacteraceae bacterium]
MSTGYVFAPPARVSAAVRDTADRFPVRRIFCVGRNYAAHVREMGGDPRSEPPIFFTKPADALVAGGTAVPYPPGTRDLHYEVELVVALHSGGKRIPASTALTHVYGYAVGNDLTRRDLQAQARSRGQPWDMAKGFDASAQMALINPVERFGHPSGNAIWLRVNGEQRQQSTLDQMIWSVPEIISGLSALVELQPGDLIYTGTPDGVGALLPGDLVTAGIEGLDQLEFRIVAGSP